MKDAEESAPPAAAAFGLELEPDDKSSKATAVAYDYPDGGKAAWLNVLGSIAAYWCLEFFLLP